MSTTRGSYPTGRRSAAWFAALCLACIGLAIAGPPPAAADNIVDFTKWTGEFYPTFGDDPVWTALPHSLTHAPGVQCHPSFYYSDFPLPGEIRATVWGRTENDRIGFALFHPGATTGSAADYLLLDWKGAPDEYQQGYTAEEGLRLCRITGAPSRGELWAHVAPTVQELAGVSSALHDTGWQACNPYEFRLRFTPAALRATVTHLPTATEVGSVDTSGDFRAVVRGARFACFVFDQPDVEFTADCLRGSRPLLGWKGSAGFTTDGVEPNRGPAGSLFTFAFRLTDRDGDEPYDGPWDPLSRRVRLILDDGSGRRLYAMRTTMAPTRRGRVYQLSKRLPAGTYRYAFAAEDKDGSARLVGPRPIVVNGATGPRLEWLGRPAGFAADGVQPDKGRPRAVFTFKVKYTDPSGTPPRSAHCVIQKRTLCGWPTYRSMAMQLESGAPLTGAVYRCATQLPGEVFRYRFAFRDATGREVGGEPASFHQGPLLITWPRLMWSGNPGYKHNGAWPNYGPPGTQFRFEVRYMSPAGEAPTTHQLLIRYRKGSLYRRKSMTPAIDGDDHSGRIYETTVALPDRGPYECRFLFRDSNGVAHGSPNNWMPGPRIESATTAAVTSPAAVPTAAGAQITFGLTAPAQVQARVLNIAGRPIATICRGRDCDAGTNTLLWDARSDQGLPVPNGTYLIEVAAQTEDGAQARALGQVRIAR